ncbi:uncharacterized protein LOC113403464 [Vanessa tameamea]|uniref:Uncharacterized protein LOC113403464 n=1 Tax=Vanessa tameamea TaxID=334116 RepID=A0A8B8IRR1_VANTA
MLLYCDQETGSGTNRKTTSDESKQEVSMQPDSSSESSSEDESAPPDDTQYYYDKAIAESLAENMYNLSVESDDDDDYDDLNPSPSSRPPKQPFVFENYSEDDSEESDIYNKISKIAGLEHLVVNSPLWYAHVKPHLTELEREELWNRTPWAVKFYWDDSDDADADDEAAPPFFKDQYYIAVI